MQVDELKLLWKRVFGDDDVYIDRFFSQIYSPENTLVYEEDGHIVSMLYMIPYDLCINGSHFKAMYLYALATDEKYRGRRFMSGLIHRAHEIVEKKGYLCSFLIPEGESLYQYYRRFGYAVPFYGDEIIIKLDRLSPDINFAQVNISIDELWNIHSSFYGRQDKEIMLDRRQFIFFLEDFHEAGGKVYCMMEADKAIGYVYGISKNGRIKIYQTNIDYSILKGKKINAVIQYHIRGLFRPSKECLNLGMDLKRVWVKNVLC